MYALDSGSRPPWLTVLIEILSFILTILSGAGGILALGQTRTGVSAQGLDPSASWFWILLLAVIVLAIVTWAFRMWLKRRGDTDDELFDQVLGFVDWVLGALKDETGKRLREIPQSEVEDAARQVYGEFIEGSPLALVPEDVFVRFVVERWRQMAGVQIQVKMSVTRTRKSV